MIFFNFFGFFNLKILKKIIKKKLIFFKQKKKIQFFKQNKKKFYNLKKKKMIESRNVKFLSPHPFTFLLEIRR